MTQPPVHSALVVQRGATDHFEWDVLDPDSGLPMDLSAWTAQGQIRAWFGAPDVLAEMAVAVGTGKVLWDVAADESAAWGFDEAVYGIELSGPGGVRISVALGPLQVAPEIVT